jgi:hypothetical protein
MFVTAATRLILGHEFQARPTRRECRTSERGKKEKRGVEESNLEHWWRMTDSLQESDRTLTGS